MFNENTDKRTLALLLEDLDDLEENNQDSFKSKTNSRALVDPISGNREKKKEREKQRSSSFNISSKQLIKLQKELQQANLTVAAQNHFISSLLQYACNFRKHGKNGDLYTGECSNLIHFFVNFVLTHT